MPIARAGIAPYGSPASVLAVIQHHRQKRFKDVVDLEMVQLTGIAKSEAQGQRTIQALKLLDLIDEGRRPTAALNGLAEAPEDEFKTRLQEVIRQAYAPIFEVVEPSDGYGRVRDAFRTNTPHAQQPRMVTLFLHLCVAAGMISETPQASSPGPKNPKPPRSEKGRQEPWVTAKHAPARPERVTVPSGRFSTIEGVLAKLPESGEWTKPERDKWYGFFGTALDFDIAIVEAAAPGQGPKD